MKKFLIINIFGIGDVLFTTPLIDNIKENIPDAVIGYLCNKRASDVLEKHPTLNKIFIYEKDDYRALFKKSKILFSQKVVQSLREIRREKFDVVIDLSLNRLSSFFMWLLGIPVRVGFNYKNRSPFLTKAVAISGYDKKHVVEWYLDLMALLGMRIAHKTLRVVISEADRNWAKDILRRQGILPGDLLIGCVPGGGASWGADARFKRWTPERYGALADRLIEKHAAKILLLGDAQEIGLGQAVMSAMKYLPVSFIGQTSLGQYFALLARCRLVIVNDGGPLHMAVAAGAKTVSLFGPVDEAVYGPYPPAGHVVVTSPIACRPCYRQFRRADCEHIGCINHVSVDEFFSQVESALKKN